MKKKTLVMLLLVCCFGVALLAYAATGDLFVNGNLGVGTTTPGAKLHIVNGNARFSAVSEAWSEGIRIDVARNAWGGIRWYRGDANYNGNWALGYKNDSTDDLIFTNNNGGTQYDRLVLTKSGNVGIGTTNPQAKLDVDGGIRLYNDLLFTGDGTIQIANGTQPLRFFMNSVEKMRLEQNGNVGIGTTPQAPLHIYGGAAAYIGEGLLLGKDSGNNNYKLEIRSAAPNSVAYLDFANDAATDYDMRLILTGDDALGIEGGNVGIGTATPAYKLDVAGTINAQQVLVNGAPLAGGSNQWSNLTAPAAGVYYTAGNVGIGTTTPGYKLDVNGTGRFTEGISVIDGYSNLTFLGNTPSIKGGYSLLLQGNANPDNPRLFLDGSGSSTNNSLSIGSNTNPYQMYINTAIGNVGIGTTNPQVPLAVAAGGQAGIGHTTTDYVPSVSGSGVFTALGADTGNTYGEIRALSGGGGTWDSLILQKGGGRVGIGTITPTRKLSFGTGQSSIGTDDQGVNTNAGGMLFINSGSGGTGTTGGAGGNLRLEAGYAGGSGNNDGGDVFLTPGSAAGSGTRGRVVIDSARGPGSDGGLGFNSTLRFRSHGQANWDIVNDGSLNFIYNPNPTGPINVVFKNNGNVGIGTTTPAGKLDVNGTIYQRGGVLHADYVFEPAYKLESVEEHASFMWENKHLKAVDSQRKDENGQELVEIGGRTRGILEELEKAHIYIEQLHNQNKELTRRVETLEKSLGMKN